MSREEGMSKVFNADRRAVPKRMSYGYKISSHKSHQLGSKVLIAFKRVTRMPFYN